MHDTKDTIERRLTAVKSQRSSGELEDLALIIGAFSLEPDAFDD
jgi:phospholipid-transporting ATPase